MTIDEIHIGDTILTCHADRTCVMSGFVRPLTIDGYRVEITRDGNKVTAIDAHGEYGEERIFEDGFYELFFTPSAAEEYVRKRAENAHAGIDERLTRSLEEIELMQNLHPQLVRDAETD